MKKYLILLLLASNVYADFDYVDKGSLAPYAGYLITLEREKKLRLMDNDLNLCNSLSDSYKKANAFEQQNSDILTKRVELYQKENAALAERAVKSSTFWEDTLYFTLGAVLTGAIAVGVAKASK